MTLVIIGAATSTWRQLRQHTKGEKDRVSSAVHNHPSNKLWNSTGLARFAFVGWRAFRNLIEWAASRTFNAAPAAYRRAKRGLRRAQLWWAKLDRRRELAVIICLGMAVSAGNEAQDYAHRYSDDLWAPVVCHSGRRKGRAERRVLLLACKKRIRKLWKLMRQHGRSFDPHIGKRVGEAAKPGPSHEKPPDDFLDAFDSDNGDLLDEPPGRSDFQAKTIFGRLAINKTKATTRTTMATTSTAVIPMLDPERPRGRQACRIQTRSSHHGTPSL